jgi:Protein of unknown function (DUF3014)
MDDDRPYLTPVSRPPSWPVPLLALAAVAAFVGYFYYLSQRQPEPSAAPIASAPAVAPQSPAKEASPATPGIPLAPPQASLPELDRSDALARDSIVALIGRKAFDERFAPDQLIRRIVATVDNLPRPTAARNKMPLDPVPGAFAASGTPDEALVDAANFARYEPFLRVMASLDARALVYSYVRAYPLFQRAYEELGYPGKHFNDRLVQAIDDMLGAPQIDAPIKLVRPHVLYEYADPDLEARSAGQKILLRVGGENAARIKAKLREIRREIFAASR